MNSRLSSYQSFAQTVLPWIAGLTAAIAIVASAGSQPAALLMFLIALPLCFIKSVQTVKISPLWILAFTWPLIASIPLFIASETGEALSAAARYCVAAITLIGLRRIRLDTMILLRAASAGGILAILFNLDQLGEMRVNWGVGFLDSGYISVLLLGLALAQFHLDRGKSWWRIYAVIGIACLVVAVMKTGTRGAWPAMIFVFLIQFVLLDLSPKKKMLMGLAGILLFVVATFTVPSVKQRIDLTVNDFYSYYEENNHATSMGYRLDFWRIAVKCFAENPIWGVSYQRRSEIMQQYVNTYPESTSIGNDGRSSSHNEILNALSKKGLLGMIAILLLYLVPMRYFIQRLRSSSCPQVRHLSLAGTGMVITIIICGITEAPMMNVRVATSYGFLMIFLYHLISVSLPSNKTGKISTV